MLTELDDIKLHRYKLKAQHENDQKALLLINEIIRLRFCVTKLGDRISKLESSHELGPHSEG